MNKLVCLIYFLLIGSILNAQEQIIETTGTGKTYDIAYNNALRYALESVFGTFISSETRINNDIIEKDEIYALSSGNISKITVVSQTKIGENHSVTLKVVVAPQKLAEFVKSKGMSIDYDAEPFASSIKAKMKVEAMNERNEEHIINSLITFSEQVLKDCFDYDIKATEPYLTVMDEWVVKLSLNVKANNNLNILIAHITKTLDEISLKTEPYERYKIGKRCFGLSLNGKTYTLRSNNSRRNIWHFLGDKIFPAMLKIKVYMNAGKDSRNLKIAAVNLERHDWNFNFHSEWNEVGEFRLKDLKGLSLNRYPEISEYPAGSRANLDMEPAKLIFSDISALFEGSVHWKNTEGGIDAMSLLKGFNIIK